MCGNLPEIRLATSVCGNLPGILPSYNTISGRENLWHSKLGQIGTKWDTIWDQSDTIWNPNLTSLHCIRWDTHIRFWIKVGQIGNNWTNWRLFRDLFSVKFCSPSQNILKMYFLTTKFVFFHLGQFWSYPGLRLALLIRPTNANEYDNMTS